MFPVIAKNNVTEPNGSSRVVAMFWCGWCSQCTPDRMQIKHCCRWKAHSCLGVTLFPILTVLSWVFRMAAYIQVGSIVCTGVQWHGGWYIISINSSSMLSEYLLLFSVQEGYRRV